MSEGDVRGDVLHLVKVSKAYAHPSRVIFDKRSQKQEHVHPHEGRVGGRSGGVNHPDCRQGLSLPPDTFQNTDTPDNTSSISQSASIKSV